MAKQTREAVGAEKLTALADRGYFHGEEILECERAGINAVVPKPPCGSIFRKSGCTP